MKKARLFAGLLASILVVSCASVPTTISVMPNPELPNVQTTEIEVKNTLELPVNLTGINHMFEHPIKWHEFDPSQNQLLVFMQKQGENPRENPGTLLLYDLTGNCIIWSVWSFATQGDLTADRVIVYGYGSTFGLDRNTGEVVWERLGSFFDLDASREIAYSGLLTMFDLNTGLDVWSSNDNLREITNQWGWLEETIIDSTLIVAVDGLHTFQIETGNGWDLNMPTGYAAHGKALAKDLGTAVLMGVLGGLTGTYVYTPPSEPDRFTELCSNICCGNGNVFFYANEHLVCVDLDTGTELWHTTTEEKAGTSLLYEQDNGILMIANGRCQMNGLTHEYGVPFVARYDKLTGEELNLEFVRTETPLKDHLISKDGVYLMSERDLYFYNETGDIVVELSIPESDSLNYGYFLRFVSEPENWLMMENDRAINLGTYCDVSSNNVQLAVRTSEGIILYDNEYAILKWIPKDRFNRISFSTRSLSGLNS